ncbi:hypothetical protein [Streptomyces sp. NPDC127197]|uniref:hypothetical protein n=1 Tax=Streptomyces sp. NPDC127197 TaxID=3345388 RepID=UPI00362CEDF2
MDEDTRKAAWGLYLALHHLAAAALIGELETSYEADGRLFEGDFDYALRILLEDGPRIAVLHPDLVERVRALLRGWESTGPEGLQSLLGLLDDLEKITGSSLPLPLPPGL